MASPTQRSPSAAQDEKHAQDSPAHAPDALTELLSYPTPSSEVLGPLASSSSASAQPRTILKDRLYVGNLHPTVDEYTLLQLFSKFGKISKLDFLFHKSGPLKGKPRGYAFVEFANRDDAEKALTHANDKLLRGRKLVVTYANQAPLDAAGGQVPGARSRRPVSDVGKPTTLSLLKSAGTGRSDATDAKIARMEAKLRQLESSAAAGGSSGGTGAGACAGGSLPGHPSLPPKPVAASIIPASRPTPTNTAPPTVSSRDRGRGQPLPILPIRPYAALPAAPIPKQSPLPLAVSSTSTPSPPPRAQPPRKSGLAGVRIVKSKPNKSSG